MSGQDIEQERQEEYDNIPKWERELGEMLFDIYVGHFRTLIAAHGGWNDISFINKLLWIRTARDGIRTMVGVA